MAYHRTYIERDARFLTNIADLCGEATLSLVGTRPGDAV